MKPEPDIAQHIIDSMAEARNALREGGLHDMADHLEKTIVFHPEKGTFEYKPELDPGRNITWDFGDD